jgi:hypothetical protein
MTNFLRFDGGFELKNHGTLTLTRASTIRPGQAVYNYGAFSIPPDAALTIRAGGLFCNTSSAYIGGDILNYGTLKSSGYLESGNEFKNFAGAETWITQLIVKDEITNDGSMYLQGSIESLNKSFKNTGTVIGMEGPCNSIKASGNIINTGLLDGTDGVIAIVKEENQFNDSGSREGDVVFKDTEDLSEDCRRILPVEWTYFELAYLQATGSVKLRWGTQKEWENSHFDIERLGKNPKIFTKIGEVPGVGWSDELQAYEFNDQNLPLVGGPVYYRIRQVDLHGTYAYSATLMVKVPAMVFTKGVWRVYPNPIENGEKFRIALLDATAYQNEPITLRMINLVGGSVPQTFRDEAELNQYLEKLKPQDNKGLEVIQLQWGNKVERIKLLRK